VVCEKSNKNTQRTKNVLICVIFCIYFLIVFLLFFIYAGCVGVACVGVDVHSAAITGAGAGVPALALGGVNATSSLLGS
jgi:hypothetical protein